MHKINENKRLTRNEKKNPEALQLASESYKTMEENFEQGYMCIAEYCYILKGVKLEQCSLLFCALRQLIDIDFKESHQAEIRQAMLMDIQVNLPLPQIVSEWGVARLILRIKLPSITILLKLLLLERSVLVLGNSCEEVSSCAFALLELLKPFKWPSIFIPSLSEEMMGFTSA